MDPISDIVTNKSFTLEAIKKNNNNNLMLLMKEICNMLHPLCSTLFALLLLQHFKLETLI